jgi:osmotically-inducible protein OsmY
MKTDTQLQRDVGEDSVVTLTGKVQNWAERETATTSAWGTPSVSRVVDEMALEY